MQDDYWTFKQFVDLSDVKELDVNLTSLTKTAHFYSSVKDRCQKVRIAVLSPADLIETLKQARAQASADLFEIFISDSVEKCADYLKVNKHQLKLEELPLAKSDLRLRYSK